MRGPELRLRPLLCSGYPHICQALGRGSCGNRPERPGLATRSHPPRVAIPEVAVSKGVEPGHAPDPADAVPEAIGGLGIHRSHAKLLVTGRKTAQRFNARVDRRHINVEGQKVLSHVLPLLLNLGVFAGSKRTSAALRVVGREDDVVSPRIALAVVPVKV